MTVTENGMTELAQLAQRWPDSGAPTGDWLEPLRVRAAGEVAALGLPDRRQEAWRYTPVGFLDQHRYVPAMRPAPSSTDAPTIERLHLEGVKGPRLVFVNGYFAPALSEVRSAGDGVTLVNLAGDLGEVPEALRTRLDQIGEHRHVFAALNSALMSDGVLLHVAEGARLSAPIEVLHLSTGADQPPILHPRHLVVLEAGARAHLIERYLGADDGVYFNNAMIEVEVGPGGELVHERLQEESDSAQHLSELQVRLERDSRYRHVTVALGGSWSRNDIKTVFAGPGASAEFDGLMLVRDRQLNDIHLDVRHDVPECTSRENFRGILDGQGRQVFDGRIVVARDAQKTDASLSNHNLMLSRSAEVDTKPQLEIYADDVKCSHGTTVGELDHDMLFYLRSRGIGAHRARQMLCLGFAEEVLARITEPSLAARARELLAGRLVESV